MPVTFLGRLARPSQPLPLFLCRVSAGFPSPAEDHVDANLSLDDLCVQHPAATYFLRMRGDSLVVWGGWHTVEGYDHGVANGVQIICNRERQTCLEAYASLLNHTQGRDLEAQAFDYQVTTWDAQRLVAINKDGMGECLDRILQVDLVAEGATLEWRPGADECQVDTGKAVLVGDPL